MVSNKILVVDDDPIIVTTIKDSLKIDGYLMVSACNGKQGMEVFKNEQPILIILDLGLPDMNGIRFLESLNLGPSDSFFVIVLTGDDCNENIEKCFELGVSAFLRKPFNMSELRGLVKHSVELKQTQVELEQYKNQLETKSRDLEKTTVSKEYLDNIVKSMAEALIVVNPDTTIKMVNNATLNLLGYDEGELIGKPISMIIEDNGLEDVIINDNAIQKRMIKRKENTYITKAAQKIPVMFSNSVLHNQAGEIDGSICVAIDISERKLKEENLIKAQEYVRSLIECSMDMIISVDQNHRIVEFNKAAQETFGYTKEDVLGKKISMLYHDLSQAKNVPIELAKKGYSISEILNKRKNGDVFTSFVSMSNLKDQEGNVIGSMGVSRDITKVKHAEEELRTAKEAAVAGSKAKDEFLATMSHEIRTPLNGIIGMGELIMECERDDNWFSLVRILNSEANALLGIINNVLDFSKIEAGKLELEKIPFDLRTTIDDICYGFTYRALEKGVTLNHVLDPKVTSLLIGDPGRLRQILTNLIGNAMKFTDKGEVFVSGELVEEVGDKVKLLFWVKDSGIGIPKDKQALIFDSFSQVDSSTTRTCGGTGLGVTISKQLAKQMGGDLSVKSEDGVGSTFSFTVIFEKQRYQVSGKKIEKFMLTEMRVLIVDSQQTNRDILNMYLQSWGCITVDVSNVNEALVVLEESVALDKRFALVLSDLKISGEGSMELARLMKKRDDFKNIPVIILTSVGEVGDAKRCREIGIQGYLTKPIRMDYLQNSIMSVLAFSQDKPRSMRALPLVTKHTIAETVKRNDIHILLVEDYPTNQQVAMKHFQSIGFNVDLVTNGLEAVDAYRKKHYQLIFMDIQMPEMDGFDATQKIREYEKSITNDSVPFSTHAIIIAMTAYATTKDRKKCFKIGMDDYITKPLRKKLLLDVTYKWIKQLKNLGMFANENNTEKNVENFETETELQNSEQLPVVDFEHGLHEFDGDREFFLRLLNVLLNDIKVQMKKIESAIKEDDLETVWREAHSIKGGAADLAVNRLSKVAAKLEIIGKEGDINAASKIIVELETELMELEEFVKKQG